MPGPLATLTAVLNLDASGYEKTLKSVQGQTQKWGGVAQAGMRVAAGAIGGGLAFAAKGALDLENRAAAFQAETGASADEAAHFKDVINDMSGSTLVAMDDIAMSATKIRTDLNLTGAEADSTLQSFLAYERATRQGADAVLAFDDILDAWNLEATDSQAIMDVLIKSHQLYGGSIEENQRLLASLAPALQAANMSWQEGQGLLNLFARAGVSGDAAVTAFNRALGKVESPEELQTLLEKISATEDPFVRARMAADLFGARAGTKLAQALSDANGDLGKFTVGMDDAAGATEAAAGALDNTITAKFQLALNHARSLLVGFGNDVGPILVGAMSAINLAGALGLDRVLGPLFKSAGSKAAVLFSGAFKVVNLFTGAASSLLKAGWEGYGRIAGSRFGKAFGIAAAAAMALIIIDEINQLNALKAANAAQAQANTQAMKDLLAEAPTRAEAEARLAGLKAIPETLDGVQSAIKSVGDLGAGNVLGSGFDILFGANPAANLQDQIRALEAYIATLPPELEAQGRAVGEALGAGLEDGIAQIGPGFAHAMTGLSVAGDAIRGTISDPIKAEMADSVAAVKQGFGNLKQAIANPPQIISRADRLQNLERKERILNRRRAAAVKGDDPWNVPYYDRALESVRTRQDRLRGNTARNTAQIRMSHTRSARGVQQTWQETTHAQEQGSRQAADTAVSEAHRIESVFNSINLVGAGMAMMMTLAGGIRLGIPQVTAAASQAAAAARTAFAAGGGGGGGGGNTYNVGTLVATAGGLDELDRATNQRRGRTSRTRRLYNEP